MKTFHRLFLIIALSIATSPGAAPADPPADDIWVNIRYQDRGMDQPAVECYGQIHKSDFLAITGSAKPNEFLKVFRVALMQDGQFLPLSETNDRGIKLGFKNAMYIRADMILRVVELDDTFVTQRLLPLKE